MGNNKAAINIFWTGGWDSTFRIMQLLDKGRTVKPHYVIRNMQAPIEIYTMIEIREAINKLFPSFSKMILPTIYTDSDAVQPNNLIYESFESLNSHFKVNKQYRDLACYTAQNNLSNIELSILGGINPAEPDYRNNECELFKYFSFPLLGATKKEMYEETENRGWANILQMTRFCRNNRIKIRKPCGYCGPCNDVVESGLGRRLPFSSRIIATLQLPLRRYWRKNHKRQGEGVFALIKRHLQTKL